MDELEKSKLKAQFQQEREAEFPKRTNDHLVKVHTIAARRRYRQSRKLKAVAVPWIFWLLEIRGLIILRTTSAFLGQIRA
jgi:hypothetical protein